MVGRLDGKASEEMYLHMILKFCFWVEPWEVW